MVSTSMEILVIHARNHSLDVWLAPLKDVKSVTIAKIGNLISQNNVNAK